MDEMRVVDYLYAFLWMAFLVLCWGGAFVAVYLIFIKKLFFKNTPRIAVLWNLILFVLTAFFYSIGISGVVFILLFGAGPFGGEVLGAAFCLPGIALNILFLKAVLPKSYQTPRIIFFSLMIFFGWILLGLGIGLIRQMSHSWFLPMVLVAGGLAGNYWYIRQLK